MTSEPIHAGFDLHPRLTAADRQLWQRFLDDLGFRYASDPRVVDDPGLHGVGGLSFPGEGWFWFPHAAWKFRRFAAPLTPQSKAAGVEAYLRDVTRVACKYFGRRVRPWHEGRGRGGWVVCWAG
jgi:hypothetical protein